MVRLSRKRHRAGLKGSPASGEGQISSMTTVIESRSVRLIRRLPRLTFYSGLELFLLALIAIQAARFAWLLVTPLGPVGDYRGNAPAVTTASAVAESFDPFFRLSAGGPAVVTSLTLKLYGVREDRATGRGSAIIALPNGSQSSFGVGEEIMPGVTLTAVGFDHVTISRNGSPEQIFLDQSQAAPAATAPPAAAQPVITAPPPPGQMQSPIRMPVPASRAPGAGGAPASPGPALQPRQTNGRVTGIAVNLAGETGRALQAAGLENGDVIVSINGQRINSLEQARALARQSGDANIIVNRGGRAVPLRTRLNL